MVALNDESIFMIKRIPKKLMSFLAIEFFKKFRQRHIYTPLDTSSLSINLVTSWDKQCGITTYSTFLADELRKNAEVFVAALPKKHALNPYFAMLGKKVASSHDIVHVQFEYGLFSSLKFGKKTLTAFASLPFYLGVSHGNRHVVTTIHEPRKTVSAGGRSGFFFTKLLDNLIFMVSDLIIVHTLESKHLMQTLYGVPASKLRVIPHGSYQKPTFLDKEECKRKFGLQGKTVVTILGFVTPKKGHDLVIPLLPQLDPNVQLVIAGGPQTEADAQFIEKLKKLAEQHQVSYRVTFTGYLSDMSPILNATDLAVLPYRFVTDSGVLHLLVSYSVPILASDLAAFKEIQQEYGCVELFRSEDTQDLLMKIQSLLSNEELRDSLKAQCKNMWNTTKWSNIAQRHIEVYREVLSTCTKDM
jgi:glycosyltransferase involved in cell wall biosynthesis